MYSLKRLKNNKNLLKDNTKSPKKSLYVIFFDSATKRKQNKKKSPCDKSIATFYVEPLDHASDFAHFYLIKKSKFNIQMTRRNSLMEKKLMLITKDLLFNDNFFDQLFGRRVVVFVYDVFYF